MHFTWWLWFWDETPFDLSTLRSGYTDSHAHTHWIKAPTFLKIALFATIFITEIKSGDQFMHSPLWRFIFFCVPLIINFWYKSNHICSTVRNKLFHSSRASIFPLIVATTLQYLIYPCHEYRPILKHIKGSLEMSKWALCWPNLAFPP